MRDFPSAASLAAKASLLPWRAGGLERYRGEVLREGLTDDNRATGCARCGCDVDCDGGAAIATVAAEVGGPENDATVEADLGDENFFDTGLDSAAEAVRIATGVLQGWCCKVRSGSKRESWGRWWSQSQSRRWGQKRLKGWGSQWQRR